MKKFQVFVCSTYRDLLPERQAVVEAILMAGHIPAGMELFAAGDKSQLETIRRWIDESDLFMLILGGRYGTIEEESGKSYIQLEYEFALERGKPVFAAVISEPYLDAKVKAQGKEVLEDMHPDLYQSFRKTVMSRICRHFDDTKDLKLIVHESIPEVTRSRDLPGWVRSTEVLDPKPMLQEMAQLRAENAKLTKRTAELEKGIASDTYHGYTYDELLNRLSEEKVSIARLRDNLPVKEAPLLNMFIALADQLGVGIENSAPMSDTHRYIFFELAPKLAIYGLTEKKNVGNKGLQRFQTSELGNRFLAKAKPWFDHAIKVRNSIKTQEPPTTPADASPKKVAARKSRQRTKNKSRQDGRKPRKKSL